MLMPFSAQGIIMISIYNYTATHTATHSTTYLSESYRITEDGISMSKHVYFKENCRTFEMLDIYSAFKKFWKFWIILAHIYHNDTVS